LPGIALALKYHFDVSVGAFLFLLVGVFFIWLLERITDLPLEALTATVFTTSIATMFLFLPEEKTQAALLGDISQITLRTCLITLVISCIAFLLTRAIYKQMILIIISPDIAQTRGINVARYNFVYLLCIALMVALGIRVIGGLMTAALVAIPASTSKNLSNSLSQYAYLSLFFGGISCLLGIVASLMLTIPVGSAIILANSFFFFLSLGLQLR
jgi:zinc transport system permease protein